MTENEFAVLKFIAEIYLIGQGADPVEASRTVEEVASASEIEVEGR